METVKEKKEIGTLIELLNEYSEKRKFGIIWKLGEDPIGVYGYVGDKYGLGWASKLVVISKEYGFIKWLVENDKIDFDKVEKYWKEKEIGMTVRGYDIDTEMCYYLIMTLSISDTPIDDLCSYLS